MSYATRFVQPMDYDGTYPGNWAGYVFKEALGYTSGRHTGVDYNGPGAGNADLGMEVKSISNGTVVYIGNLTSAGYGNTTIIRYDLHPILASELGTDTLYARYMHQQVISVSVNQQVETGQMIGRVGNSGTNLAHLHVDLWKGNLGVHLRYDKDTQLDSYLDPFMFINNHQAEIAGGDSVERIKSMYLRLMGREADQDGINHYTKQANDKGWGFVYDDLKNSPEGQSDWERRNPTRVRELEAKAAAADALQAQVSSLSSQLVDVQTALKNEQSKPPKEIVKEVEKIVEVPVGGIDQATKDSINETNGIVKAIQTLLSKIFK